MLTETPQNNEKELIPDLLDAFQEVLNWCYEINDDDSRLPLDLLDKSHQVINAATIRFQPEKVLKSFEEVHANWEQNECSGDCNNGSDVCACEFVWECPECKRKVTASGEDMSHCADIDGVCQNCDARLTAENNGSGFPEYESHSHHY